MTSNQIKLAKKKADERFLLAKQAYKKLDMHLRMQAAKLLVESIKGHPSASAAHRIGIAPQQMYEMQGLDSRMRYGVDAILDSVDKCKKIDWSKPTPKRTKNNELA